MCARIDSLIAHCTPKGLKRDEFPRASPRLSKSFSHLHWRGGDVVVSVSRYINQHNLCCLPISSFACCDRRLQVLPRRFYPSNAPVVSRITATLGRETLSDPLARVLFMKAGALIGVRLGAGGKMVL